HVACFYGDPYCRTLLDTTRSVRQIGNVSVTYGNPRSLMEGTETLCLPCHIPGLPLSELRRSAPQNQN
ncbi:hypothetical protein M9458_012167, partial [Cirrhinus mrigala]